MKAGRLQRREGKRADGESKGRTKRIAEKTREGETEKGRGRRGGEGRGRKEEEERPG